jgi:cytochrome c biogenesis protein CcdA
MSRNKLVQSFILLTVFTGVFGDASLGGVSSPVQEDSFEIHVFYIPCELCTNPKITEKMNETVYPFYEQYQANATFIFHELVDDASFEALTTLVGEDQLVGRDPPYVVFVKEEQVQVLGYEELSEETLTLTFENFQSGVIVPSNTGIAFTVYVFLIGLVTGINPCLFVLILFLISRSLLVGEKEEGGAPANRRSRVLARIGAVCLGVLIFYFLLGIFFFQIPASFFDLVRPLLLLMLVALGIYHIVFYKKVQWGLFRTPDRLKNVIQRVVEHNNLSYDFSLGFVFASVKIPCIGGLYLILLNRIRIQPAQGLLYLGLFNVSLILPLFVIMGAVALGVVGLTQTQAFTETHRGTIRLLTGALLIGAALIELLIPTSVYEFL